MDPPDGLEHIWEWFVLIAPSLGMGAGLFQEIDAFCRLRRIEMCPWEVSMLWMLHAIQNTSRRDGTSNAAATTGTGVAAVMRGLRAKREETRA